MRKNKKDEYIGKENYNNQGYRMKVVGYTNYDNIIVEFTEPYSCKLKTKMDHFKNGSIINPYAPTICGVGIVGNKYSTILKNSTREHCREYQTWINMLKRCYDEKSRSKNPTYKDVEVDNIWHYYENFYEWIHDQENYNAIKNDDYGIDKDILVKGNKLYTPNRCILVPRKINNLIIMSDAIRGNYPVGVHFNKKNRKYIAQCGGKDNHVYLGSFDSEIEAFIVYKIYKENIIKKTALEEFKKGTITEQCYNALIKYNVEITD